MLVRTFQKVCMSLLCILILSLGLLGHSQKLRNLINQKVATTFKKDFKAQFSGELSALSPLFLSATYKQISVTPCDKNEGWHYQIQECTVTVSLLHYLLHRKCKVNIALKGCTVFSEKTGRSLAITKHIQAIATSPKSAIPFVLGSIRASHNRFECIDHDNNLSMVFAWNNTIEQGRDGIHLNLFATQGTVTYKDKKLLDGLEGKITAHATMDQKITAAIDLTWQLPELPKNQQQCSLYGSWDKDSGSLTCRNNDDSLTITPLDFSLVDGHVALEGTIQLSLAHLMSLAGKQAAQQIKGNCTITLTGIIPDNLSVTLLCDNPSFGQYALTRLTATGQLAHKQLTGTIAADYLGATISGIWSWDATAQTLTSTIAPANHTTLGSATWTLPEDKTAITTTLSMNGELHIQGAAIIEHSETDHHFACSLEVDHDKQHTHVAGTLKTPDTQYQLTYEQDPFLITITEQPVRTPCEQQQKNTLKEEVFTLRTNKPESDNSNISSLLLPLTTPGQKNFSGTVNSSIIQKITSYFSPITLMGKALFEFNGTWDNAHNIHGSVTCHDAGLRIPSMYNFMDSLSFNYALNLIDLQMNIKKLAVTFQKGSITSEAITGGFSRAKSTWWAHAPVVFSEYFINWSKDLYAEVSGALILKKTVATQAHLSGFLIIDKGHLRENIFSQKTQQLLTDSFTSSAHKTPLTADIHISTRSALSVKTKELETKAHLNVQCITINGTPELDGEITLTGGVFHFPANSLAIIKGKISFSEGHTEDPFVELVGQGRIKKYMVTLAVGGTAQDPHILFESVPTLSQEQIVMLLFAGSPEESLNIVAPALVMRNVETLIFGSPSRLRNEYLMQPLKKITFLPRFTDQTGRGGFKAALEIEVSKRLRAIIEKNFSLTEDVSFEVEYLLTDDVCLRATRDERGDLGAGLEMRFKF